MTNTPGILGAVLAGGASARFGSPKWKAKVAGETMVSRALAALAPHCDRLGIVSGDTEAASLGVEVRSDSVPGRGPLEGIRTALAWASDLSLPAVFVLACDLPLVDADLVGALIASRRTEHVVAPLGASGAEPLCALYPTTLLAEVEAALGRGEMSPSRLLGRVPLHPFPADLANAITGYDDPFLNVNTAENLALAEAALARRGETRRRT